MQLASALNSGYAAYNGGLQVAKNNGLITETERLADELLLLQAQMV
jgi:hypothetical protein